MRTLSAKVLAIDNFPFFGMSGFYRRFCENLFEAVLLLTNLLGKKAQFEPTHHCQVAFEKLKAVLTHRPVLTGPDFDDPFSLIVDASDRANGAVLLHKMLTVLIIRLIGIQRS